MSEQTQNEAYAGGVWKNALKTTSKILAAIVFVVFFANAMLLVLSPRFSAKIYGYVGFDKAEEFCLERTYDKSKSNVDLYNLIVFEQEQKNYGKQLSYINVMMTNDGYEEFCSKLDLSSAKATSNKSLIAHLCDSRAYFINQKVKCLFNLGIGAESFIHSNLASDDLTEYGYATYVQLVYNSSMTADQKKEKIETLNTTLTLDDGYVEDLFIAKIGKIRARQAVETDHTEKVLLAYALTENYKAGYLANIMQQKETEANGYKTLYSASITEYYNLIS